MAEAEDRARAEQIVADVYQTLTLQHVSFGIRAQRAVMDCVAKALAAERAGQAEQLRQVELTLFEAQQAVLTEGLARAEAERRVGALREMLKREHRNNYRVHMLPGTDDAWNLHRETEPNCEICLVLADESDAAARLGADPSVAAPAICSLGEWGALRECYRLLKANHDCATYDDTTQTCQGCAVSDALAAVERARTGPWTDSGPHEQAALRTLYERTAEMRRLFNQGGTGNVGGQMIKVFEAVDEVERAGLAQ